MKKLICGLVGLAATASFAAVDDLLITFSTKGPDTYLDGTTVLDGECYALVWSADGQFDGIAADGSAVDSADKVIITAGIAKGGKCPNVMFEVSATTAAQLAGGQYAVYVLDTRVTKNGVTTVGKANLVNAAGQVTAGIAAATLTATSAETDAATTAAVAAAAPAGVAQPKVTGIRIADGLAYISIECASGIPTVAVSGSADLAKGFTGIEGTTQNKTATTAVLVRPATAGSGFFKVQGVK